MLSTKTQHQNVTLVAKRCCWHTELLAPASACPARTPTEHSRAQRHVLCGTHFKVVKDDLLLQIMPALRTFCSVGQACIPGSGGGPAPVAHGRVGPWP